MRLDDFDFDLPPDRIAQQPARPRDVARLLVVQRDGVLDRVIRDLPGLLRREQARAVQRFLAAASGVAEAD